MLDIKFDQFNTLKNGSEEWHFTENKIVIKAMNLVAFLICPYIF